MCYNKDNKRERKERKKKMTYNKIYTDAEYMAQGFTKEEVPMIRRHDELFNMWKDGNITEEEKTEMYDLIKKLGI